MKVASSLVDGLHPAPELAAEAVSRALQAAGLERAERVLLFLTRDYVRHAQEAVIAAARAAGTLQVSGCTAYGLLNEQGWLLDQPGAVALVIGAAPLAASADGDQQPLLSFTGHSTLPHAWQTAPARAGLLDAESACWAHGRLSGAPGAEIRLSGLHVRLCLSSGLSVLSLPLTVDEAHGHDLRRLGGLGALASLRHNLPPGLRDQPPLHLIALVRARRLRGLGREPHRAVPRMCRPSPSSTSTATVR